MTESYKKRLIEKAKEIQGMLEKPSLSMAALESRLYLLIGFIMALGETMEKK